MLALTAGIIGLAGRLPDPRRVKRELASARIEPIDGLPDGKAVVVRGTVSYIDATTHVEAPVTFRRCVYWLVTFDELGIGGDYHELGRSEAGCPFLLASATGTARVVPEHPRVALPGTTLIIPMAALDNPKEHHPAVRLARSLCKRPNYPRTSSLRVTEYALMVSAQVTIKGFCTREPDPTAAEDVTGYRSELPTRPVISGSRRRPMLIG